MTFFLRVLPFLVVLSFQAFAEEPNRKMSTSIIHLLTELAENPSIGTTTLTPKLKQLSSMDVARLAVIANALMGSGTATIKDDERWESLLRTTLLVIRDNKKESPEQLLAALVFVQNRTLQDGWLSLNLREMIEEIKLRSK